MQDPYEPVTAMSVFAQSQVMWNLLGVRLLRTGLHCAPVVGEVVLWLSSLSPFADTFQTPTAAYLQEIIVLDVSHLTTSSRPRACNQLDFISQETMAQTKNEIGCGGCEYRDWISGGKLWERKSL